MTLNVSKEHLEKVRRAAQTNEQAGGWVVTPDGPIELPEPVEPADEPADQ